MVIASRGLKRLALLALFFPVRWALSHYMYTYPEWFTWARLWRREGDGGPRLELSPSTLDHTDFYIDGKT